VIHPLRTPHSAVILNAVKDLHLFFASQPVSDREVTISACMTDRTELKGWRRAKKLALIESMNPAWMDLSRDWYDCEPANYRRALDRMDA